MASNGLDRDGAQHRRAKGGRETVPGSTPSAITPYATKGVSFDKDCLANTHSIGFSRFGAGAH